MSLEMKPSDRLMELARIAKRQKSNPRLIKMYLRRYKKLKRELQRKEA